MELTTERSEPASHPLGNGFTLVEALIASAILAVVVLGTQPLFMQSISSNVSGRESTELTNSGRSKIEEYSQLDFNSAALTIDTGSEKVVSDYYSPDQHKWIDGAPPMGASVAFVRTVTVRQYSAAALQDLKLDAAEALASGTDTSFVHLKEVVVAIQGTRTLAVFGPAKQITMRIVKAH